MTDAEKTRAQLIEELAALRREVAELKGREAPGPPAEAAFEGVAKGFQVLFEALDDALFVARVRDGRIVYANPQCTRLLGVTQPQLLAASFYDFMPPAVSARTQVLVQEALKGNRLVGPYEVQYPRDDGAAVPVRLMGGIVGSGDDAVLLLYMRDISETHRARQKLAESEGRYRELVDNMTDRLYVIGTDGYFRFVNRAMEEGSGVSCDEWRRRHYLDGLLPQYCELVRTYIEAVLRGELLPPIEFSHFTADGRTVTVEASMRPTYEDGRIVGLQGVSRDITDRKQAEQALRESEARYRAVVESQTELICRFARGGVLTFVNEAYCRYFGLSAADLVGRSFMPRLPESDRSAAADRLATIAATNPTVEHDHRVLMPSGEVRWMHWVNRGIFDEQKRLVEYQAVGWDITDRRQAEEALRQSEENFRHLFEQSLDGIVVVGADGRIVSANQAFADIHGVAVSEVVGKHAADFMHPDDRVEGVERLAAAVRGERLAPGERLWRDLRADGSIALVESRSRGIRWAGRPAVQVILRDITDRVRLEEELREAQKMEAVGQLAGGIAHDFNNLMTAILCHVGLLKMHAGSPSEVLETAGVIEGAARRAAQLTSALLGFARRGKHQNVLVDMNASVQACVGLFSRTLDPRVRVVTRFGAAPALVRGDPVQVEQVILNLALNARDAMPEGGEMVLGTDVADVAEEDCGGRRGAKPGRYVVLTVQDTGRGIPEDLRRRIFEPFFTTKPRGKGTGMGLAMVYGIAKNHGGWAEIDAQARPGATFRVFLPAATGLAADAGAPPAAEPPAATRGRILVVDDEDLVRDAVSRMLAELGYDVLSAADGTEAVDLYRKLGADIGLVIIDMVMPEMDGRQCFRALRALNPALQAILSTGGPGDGSLQDILDEGGIEFVQKPYAVLQLAEAVKRALGK
jgi:PAS domain S-box-containing protein